MQIRSGLEYQASNQEDSTNVISDSETEPEMSAAAAANAATMSSFSEKTKKVAKRAEQYGTNYNIYAQKVETKKVKLKAISEEITQEITHNDGKGLFPSHVEDIDKIAKNMITMNKKALDYAYMQCDYIIRRAEIMPMAPVERHHPD